MALKGGPQKQQHQHQWELGRNKIFRHYTRATESETLEEGRAVFSTNPLGSSNASWSLRTTDLEVHSLCFCIPRSSSSPPKIPFYLISFYLLYLCDLGFPQPRPLPPSPDLLIWSKLTRPRRPCDQLFFWDWVALLKRLQIKSISKDSKHFES